MGGALLVIVNYYVATDGSVQLLPGGHNELNFLGGVVMAAFGTWWLGLFDRV